MAKCPECEELVEATDVEEGEIITCDSCGVELEVLKVKPLKVALAPEEDEDWGE